MIKSGHDTNEGKARILVDEKLERLGWKIIRQGDNSTGRPYTSFQSFEANNTG